jgi:hypothetical protein
MIKLKNYLAENPNLKKEYLSIAYPKSFSSFVSDKLFKILEIENEYDIEFQFFKSDYKDSLDRFVQQYMDNTTLPKVETKFDSYINLVCF